METGVPKTAGPGNRRHRVVGRVVPDRFLRVGHGANVREGCVQSRWSLLADEGTMISARGSGGAGPSAFVRSGNLAPAGSCLDPRGPGHDPKVDLPG